MTATSLDTESHCTMTLTVISFGREVAEMYSHFVGGICPRQAEGGQDVVVEMLGENHLFDDFRIGPRRSSRVE